MKVKLVLIAASVVGSLAGMPAAYAADQQATSAEMDNQLNVDAARYGYGEHQAYPETQRHERTWR
jgi:hypothetical protein